MGDTRGTQAHKELSRFPYGENEAGEAPGINPSEDSPSWKKFKEVKMKFLARVQEVVHEISCLSARGCFKVTRQLIINWDQTGLNVFPPSAWTMEK